MRTRNILLALLLMVASLQTALAQGFRVYKSDGTMVQFSLHKDSIAIYGDIGSDEDLGPFTPVNQCIVGTWYKSKSETITFNEDGTTDYMEGATYEFLPYQGSIIIYHQGSDTPVNFLKVFKVTAEEMIVSTPGSNNFYVMTRTQPVVLVREIVLSETSLTLLPDGLKILTATVLPEDADNPAVTWESSDGNVAEVNRNGRVIANADGTCLITCRATDGSGVYAECQVTVGGDIVVPDEHEWVDLGLPSGTLWATCNVGANSPEEYGDYYAWGETTTKTDYSLSTYKYCNGSYNTMTKYCTDSSCGIVDNKTELEAVDDAATKNWGSDWQMPSIDQLQELCNTSYTTTTWTTQNGVNGRKITSKSNGRSIFLPAAGWYNGDKLWEVDTDGFYFSRSLRTLNSNYACHLTIGSGSISTFGETIRSMGYSVRPVRVQTQ